MVSTKGVNIVHLDSTNRKFHVNFRREKENFYAKKGLTLTRCGRVSPFFLSKFSGNSYFRLSFLCFFFFFRREFRRKYVANEDDDRRNEAEET